MENQKEIDTNIENIEKNPPAPTPKAASDITVVDTSSDLGDGQIKCEACGSTEISLDAKTGMLRCHFCRHQQAGAGFQKTVTDIRNLKGQIKGSGAANIEASADDVLTFKCSSCGAEVIVDTKESTQARCHWCRNTLSVNQQIPNGAVPDKVLPFSTDKEAARKKIEEFVKKRRFFAHPQFKKEFTTNNVMGVYMPYMVVDANVKGQFSGEGERQIRTWTESRTVGTGKNRRIETTRYYDADRYAIKRDFDMTVENLTIESNSEKLQHKSSNRTNNVINAIKPFNLEKAMKWDSNYMTGYTAQKRDTNVDDLRDLVDVKLTDIARHRLLPSIKRYDRDVRWISEKLDVAGKQWKAAYFPVWLYSYQAKDKTIHYVASNGQSLKTMGSVPVNKPKLWLFSLLVGLLAGLAGFISGEFITEWLDFNEYFTPFWTTVCIIVGALIYRNKISSRYRNQKARFDHEHSTAADIHDMKSDDKLIKKIRRSTASSMGGDNSRAVKYKGSS